MRRYVSIAKATALEILTEPLSLLLLLAALVMVVMAPALHYHQFGEPVRMARDAAFSALFTCGSAFAVFPTVKSFRREIETGTFDMAIAHPISVRAFFMAKMVGAIVAYWVFFAIVFSVSMAVIEGARIGGVIAERNGEIARLWGPALALAVASILLPLIGAACLNRFAHTRFVYSFFVGALVFAVLPLGAVLWLDAPLLFSYLTAALVMAMLALTLIAVASTASARMRANGAVASCVLFAAALLPFAGNLYLADALAGGARLDIGYVIKAMVSLVPFIAAAALALPRQLAR